MQADCRSNMCISASAVGAEDVPSSDPRYMCLLRSAFKAADKKERAQMRKLQAQQRQQQADRSASGQSSQDEPRPRLRASVDL